MRGVLSQIRGLGAELVTVGSGQPYFAEAFRKEFQLDFPLLVDPGLASYQAAGLHRSLARTFKPSTIIRGIKSQLQGHRTTGVKGDAWQQGGVFIILPSGEVPYAYISDEAGDHPPVEEILAALKGAIAG